VATSASSIKALNRICHQLQAYTGSFYIQHITIDREANLPDRDPSNLRDNYYRLSISTDTVKDTALVCRPAHW